MFLTLLGCTVAVWSWALSSPSFRHCDDEVVPRAALLLVGDYSAGTTDVLAAYRSIHDGFVRPLNAEVFVVAGSVAHRAPAETVFGTQLKAFRRVPAEGCECGSGAADGTPATNTVELCASPPRYTDVPKPGRFLQWHKLRAAWWLLRAFEQAETAAGRPAFGLIAKLRPDAVPLRGPESSLPWRICPQRDGLLTNAAVLHAASDFAFWGSPSAMQAAAGTYDAMRTYFEERRPDPAGCKQTSHQLAR